MISSRWSSKSEAERKEFTDFLHALDPDVREGYLRHSTVVTRVRTECPTCGHENGFTEEPPLLSPDEARELLAALDAEKASP